MELSLKEQFLLLVYDDVKGRPLIVGNRFLYSLAGAALLELFHNKKISLRDKYVYIDSYKTSGDIVADNIINIMRKSSKKRKIKYWVQKIGFRGNKLKNTILNQMVMSGIYSKEDYKVLGIFKCYRYYNDRKSYKNELLKSIKDIVLGNKQGEEQILMLVSLVGTSGLVNKIFAAGEERRKAKLKIKQMMKDNAFGKAINETIAAANAAVVAAVTTVPAG